MYSQVKLGGQVREKGWPLAAGLRSPWQMGDAEHGDRGSPEVQSDAHNPVIEEVDCAARAGAL